MIERHEVEDMLRILMMRCNKDPKYCTGCPFSEFDVYESCGDFGPPCSWDEEALNKMTEIVLDMYREVNG